jgi:hypothetical protein
MGAGDHAGRNTKPPDPLNGERRSGQGAATFGNKLNSNSDMKDAIDLRHVQARWLQRRHLTRLCVALALAPLVFGSGR